MRIVLDGFLLAVGFVLLVQSAKVFVNASVAIAKRLRIPTLVIGLTVVAMGTSAPELIIGVAAAAGGSSDLAIANAVGSNLFNLVFIVGFCAVLFPISVKMSMISRDFWVSAGATTLLLAFAIIFSSGHIPRLAAICLLAGFLVYMFFVVKQTLKNKTEPEPEPEDSTKKPKPLWLNIVLAVIGIAVIVGAGQLTVTSAVSVAEFIGISERVIGLTVVSMGTSLPELVTTLIACRKKEGEFALGFIIGSNIFNLMLVLGLAGTILPLGVHPNVIFDIGVLLIGTLSFFIYAKSGAKLVRAEGAFMVLMYVGYMVWAIMA